MSGHQRDLTWSPPPPGPPPPSDVSRGVWGFGFDFAPGRAVREKCPPQVIKITFRGDHHGSCVVLFDCACATVNECNLCSYLVIVIVQLLESCFISWEQHNKWCLIYKMTNLKTLKNTNFTECVHFIIIYLCYDVLSGRFGVWKT